MSGGFINYYAVLLGEVSLPDAIYMALAHLERQGVHHSRASWRCDASGQFTQLYVSWK